MVLGLRLRSICQFISVTYNNIFVARPHSCNFYEIIFLRTFDDIEALWVEKILLFLFIKTILSSTWQTLRNYFHLKLCMNLNNLQ